MIEDTRRFMTECPVCDSNCFIDVLNVDEEVIYCPMCGTEAEVEEVFIED